MYRPEITDLGVHRRPEQIATDDQRLKALSRLAVHQARRLGRTELPYEDLLIEVEFKDDLPPAA